MCIKKYFTIFSIYIVPIILIFITKSAIESSDFKVISEFGEIAFNLLLLLLIIKPISILLPKIPNIRKTLLLRKELGIIIAYFSFFHGLTYLYYIETQSWNYPALGVWFGIFVIIIMFILYITSNRYSIIKLGKTWKLLHSFVYLMFFLTILHVLAIKSFKGEYHYIAFGVLVVILKILERKKISKA